MREIKFRAWDPATRHMFSPKTLEVLATTTSHIVGGWDRLEIMQYTGLKDKNGVEIYEGDVLMFDTSIPAQPFGDNPDPGEPRNSWGEVFYSEQDAAFSLRNGTKPLDEYGYNLTDFFEEFGDGEVIGNIYENPELVAEGQEALSNQSKPRSSEGHDAKSAK